MKQRPEAPPPISLRQRKAAETRLGLLEAMVRRLRRRPFEEISVKELCAEVGVSEPTFFNYFASKHELLIFYVRLWSVEMQSRMNAEASSAFEALDLVFRLTAEAIATTPRLMQEIISYQARSRVPAGEALPTRAELLLRFGSLEGAAGRSPASVQDLLRTALQRAVAEGELPAATDIETAAGVLAALFFGTPASRPRLGAVRTIYATGLRLVWSALGGRSP